MVASLLKAKFEDKLAKPVQFQSEEEKQIKDVDAKYEALSSGAKAEFCRRHSLKMRR